MPRSLVAASALVLALIIQSPPVMADGGAARHRHRSFEFRGADVSSLYKAESLGAVYRWENGRPGDALKILKAHGLNAIRLRVWVDPADGFHDTDELLEMARRAKRLGLKLLVDFHLSDFWADPGKQWTPEAWVGLPYEDLKDTLDAYLRGVMRALVAQRTPPEIVQLGNEIDPGILWDYAATWTGTSCADDGMGGTRCELHHENWDQLAELLTLGHHAIRESSPHTRVALHLSNGGNNGLYRWWFDNVSERDVPFDLIAVSYYSYWHGTLADLAYNLADITARYDKDVVLVETAYPFTLKDEDGSGQIIGSESQLTPGYPATPEGQAANFRDVQEVLRNVPGGRVLGYFWWEATWTWVPGNGWSPVDPDSGNGWENQALFDFDDRALPAMREFRPASRETRP